MKHNKSVEFLSIFRMSSPLIENCLAKVLYQRGTEVKAKRIFEARY